MTTDTAPAVPLPVPAPLTLQQRHEKALAAMALVRELQDDTTRNGDFSTFRGGGWYSSIEAAADVIRAVAYYAEYAVTMAQVEARA